MKYRRRYRPIDPMPVIALKVLGWFVSAAITFWGLAHMVEFLATH